MPENITNDRGKIVLGYRDGNEDEHLDLGMFLFFGAHEKLIPLLL